MPTKSNSNAADTSNQTRDPLATVQKIQALCALAKSPNENEATSAAVQAVKLINDSDLFGPESELSAMMKAVEGARELATKAKEENQRSMIMGALVGALVGKQFL